MWRCRNSSARTRPKPSRLPRRGQAQEARSRSGHIVAWGRAAAVRISSSWSKDSCVVTLSPGLDSRHSGRGAARRDEYGHDGYVRAAKRLTAAVLLGAGMSSDRFAIAVAVAMFGAGLLGLFLQRVLPEHHTTGGSRELIAAVVGLLTLLCALVTGLLIWTAYGVYSGQNTQIQSLAAKVMQLDFALSDYGPEANPARAQLRAALGKTIDQVWGANVSDSEFAANNFAAAIQNLRARDKVLAALRPSTDEQKQALAAAMSASDATSQARMQMAFALTAPVSYPLLLTVVGWVGCLFCGFGLTARGTATSVLALAVGSIAVASAVLLILTFPIPILECFVLRPPHWSRRWRSWARSDAIKPEKLTTPCRGSSPLSGRAPP